MDNQLQLDENLEYDRKSLEQFMGRRRDDQLIVAIIRLSLIQSTLTGLKSDHSAKKILAEDEEPLDAVSSQSSSTSHLLDNDEQQQPDTLIPKEIMKECIASN
eukprot:6467470-Ditylum_brightwellii.AAC.1